MPALTVAEMADACDGVASGNLSRMIRGANALETAAAEEVSFVSSAKAQAAAANSRAGCLIVGRAFEAPGDWSLIRVQDPRAAFARALTLLYPKSKPAPLIHPTAVVAASARVADDCYLGPFVTVGEGSEIGSGCSIGAGSHVGERVIIGADSILHPQVNLYDGVRIGARAILHTGCVIGADGFGFAFSGDHYEKFPQVGTVQIEDDVEIGANSCIDCAALGTTRIGAGSKLDNLVHIAHNCTIGKHVVIAAQTGLAGGVTVGDYAVLGGQVGIGEKAIIQARAVIGSGAGILSNQTVEAGEPVWGVPARPLRGHLKGLANVGKIPEIQNAVRELTRRVNDLENLERD